MRCAVCRQALGPGPYVRAGGADYHGDCFRCSACGRALSRYREHKGRPYCPDCHAGVTGERCRVCGLPIAGAYFKHEGGQVHPDCYRKHIAGRCDVCGGPLVGSLITDGWGHTYHAQHRAQFPPCDACGRLTCQELGGGGVRLGDGRHMCNRCLPAAVRTEGEATERFRTVRAFLEHRGMAVPDVPLRLVSRPELMKIVARSGHPPRKSVHGITLMEAELLGGQVISRKAAVFLLGSLPWPLFDGTAAHELGHAWAFLTGCPRHEYALAEGFCNYLRYLVHTADGGDDGDFYVRQMVDDPDPAYGHGFRIVRKIAERRGFPALLEHMRRKGDFPLFGW